MTKHQTIESKLTESLAPAHLEVVNESGMHSVAPGSETHFKVLVVSAAFEGLSAVARHRRVNELLRAELQSGVHALSIQALTPAQWEAQKDGLLPSAADRIFVKSLQAKAITEPGKMANWLAAPPRGINNKPLEFEYVRAEV